MRRLMILVAGAALVLPLAGEVPAGQAPTGAAVAGQAPAGSGQRVQGTGQPAHEHPARAAVAEAKSLPMHERVDRLERLVDQLVGSQGGSGLHEPRPGGRSCEEIRRQMRWSTMPCGSAKSVE